MLLPCVGSDAIITHAFSHLFSSEDWYYVVLLAIWLYWKCCVGLSHTKLCLTHVYYISNSLWNEWIALHYKIYPNPCYEIKTKNTGAIRQKDILK